MMRTKRSRLALAFSPAVVASALLAGAPAYADGVPPSKATPVQRDEALKHFTTAKGMLDREQWDGAISEFRASLEIVTSPNARLQLARALRGGGQLAAAWREYGRTIEEATSLAASEPRYKDTANAATAERTEIEGKMAFVTVKIDHAPVGATLKVGASTIDRAEWSSPIATAPGSIDIVVESGGKQVAKNSVSINAGDRPTVSLDAAPPPPVTAPPAGDDKAGDATSGPPPADTGTPRASPMRTYAIVAGGVGVAGLLTFAISGAMSTSAYSDLSSKCHNTTCPPGNEGEISSGRTEQTVANVGLVAGVVGVAAGVTLWFVGAPKAQAVTAPSAGMVFGPGWVGAKGTF
jgi:hypothetical protein